VNSLSKLSFIAGVKVVGNKNIQRQFQMLQVIIVYFKPHLMRDECCRKLDACIA
jgi:hypothetical protein